MTYQRIPFNERWPIRQLKPWQCMFDQRDGKRCPNPALYRLPSGAICCGRHIPKEDLEGGER